MRLNFTRDFYIPKTGASKITPKGIDAVIYAYERAGRLGAMGFAGKAQKPTFHYTFKTEERRAQFVSQWIKEQQEAADRKAQRKAEKRAFVHTLKVGDVLRSSWGYDQTNIDFYQVTALIGKNMVEVREICQEATETGYMCGQCVPVPGQFTDKPAMRKRVQEGNRVRMASYRCASPYEMKEIAPGVKVGNASYWSSYA